MSENIRKVNPKLATATLFLLFDSMLIQNGYAQQQADSSKPVTVFSGSLGVSNNGFSIIPSFSFNDPAAIILLYWKRKKFSVDPEFRVTPTGEKGSIILWFRYHAIEGKRFGLRVGAHPAVNWFPENVVENGVNTELIRLRRFLAWELAPSFRINKHLRISIYYLQGNGLQENGPKTTHFVNFNTTISNIQFAKNLLFTITPAFYYLNIDGNDGIFFTASAAIGHTRLPFLVQSTINQKIRSNIPNTQNFMWNVGIAYNFRKELK